MFAQSVLAVHTAMFVGNFVTGLKACHGDIIRMHSPRDKSFQNTAVVEEVGGVFHWDSQVGNSTFLVFSQYFPKETTYHQLIPFRRCGVCGRMESTPGFPLRLPKFNGTI